LTGFLPFLILPFMKQNFSPPILSEEIPGGKYPPLCLTWSVWGVGMTLYLIGFFQRVAPAVMTSELMAAFEISAVGLGSLSASYYYSYVIMQIPTGVLADSWGPRKLLTAGGMIAAVGAIIFSLASEFFWANIGRALIGGSVAVGYVALLKLSSRWLPQKLYALAAGLALFFGVGGAVAAGVPLRLLMDAFGWRSSLFASGLITLGCTLLTWWIVRDDPAAKGYRSFAPQTPSESGPVPLSGMFTGLGTILQYRNTWLLFFSPGGVVGSILTFAGLWGVPYLKAEFNLDPAKGAAVCSLLMICWAIGGPLMGGLSDRIGRRKPLYLAGCLVNSCGWALIIFFPDLSFGLFIFLIVLTGLGGGGTIIGFAFSKESVPAHLAGTIAGVINTGMMIGTPILQPVIGWILDLTWQGNLVQGVRVYDAASYKTGFAVMLVWSILSCFIVSFTKETHCRQMS
jgi:MFS family permease